MKYLASAFLISFLTREVACLPPITRNTLVAFDTLEAQSSYSDLISIIRKSGHVLTVAAVSEISTQLSSFDNILLIAGDPSVTIDAATVTDFIDRGGNVVALAGGKLPTSGYAVPSGFRKLARLCGAAIDADGSEVADYYSKGNFKGVLTNDVVDENNVMGLDDSKDFLFRGSDLFVNASNPLTWGLLRASPSSFVTTNLQIPADSGPRGTDILLMAAHQARNNARGVFAADSSLCADETFKLNPANRNLCRAALEWTFGDRGYIFASDLRHHRVAETTRPALYSMGDEVLVSVDIYEREFGAWVPYQAKDVQLEVVMLDPYIRTFLDPPAYGSATFTKVLNMPQKYGVFKLVLRHQRLGQSTVLLEAPATVRNPRHDGYPRFLFCALPFYISLLPLPAAALLCAAFVVYSAAPHFQQEHAKDSKPAEASSGVEVEKARAQVNQMKGDGLRRR